jgi:hypothetical protein
MTLPNDVSRCLGIVTRNGLTAECERRDQCARYLDQARSDDVHIPTELGLCDDGDDHMIPVTK